MVLLKVVTSSYSPASVPQKQRIFKLRPEYPAYWICGSRGGGKSASGERIWEIYYRNGYVVLDWWGSIDLENLFACIPGKLDKDRKNDPHARSVGYPVLIIHPRSMSITPMNPLCRCGVPLAVHSAETKCKRPSPLIETITDDTPLKDILVKAYKGRRICIFNKGLYQDEREAYRVMARFLRELPALVIQNVIPSSISMVLFLRELGNIAPSGLHNVAGGFETATKRAIQGLIREARHLRIVMVGDFQRSADVARSIASQRDYILVKRTTRDLLPDDYQWLYDAVHYKRAEARYKMDFENYYNMPSLSNLQPWQAYVVHPDNHFELISLHMAGFKHKKPDDTWAALANCEVRYLNEDEMDHNSTTARARATLQREAEARAKMDKLKQVQVLRQQGRSWQSIAEQIHWYGKDGRTPSAEACQKAYNRARRNGLLDPPEIQNANTVVTPGYDSTGIRPEPGQGA